MTARKIIVVDYHKGNLSSVARGLVRAGATAEISDDPAEIRNAAGVVLPGVGAFYDAIAFMHERGQDAAVLHAIAHGAPFLGICLGLQLLFERGDEGVPASGVDLCGTPSARGTGLAPGDVFEAEGVRWVRGLGVLSGSCTRHLTDAGKASPLLTGFPEGTNMYFTHSYAACDVDPSDLLAVTHYTRSFPAVVGRERVFGCQFHPEKSSARGLDVLRNFAQIVEEAGA